MLIADHVAVRIEQRSAAVARIDRRVRLNHAFQVFVFGLDRAVERTHDADGQRAVELPKGLPMAMTFCPTIRWSESPSGRYGSLRSASILISARSFRGSTPSTRAL